MKTVMATAIIVASFVGSARANDDEQWIYRVSDNQPIVVFMSWDFTKVLFRVTCTKRTLSIEYFGDDAIELKKGDPMAILLDDREQQLAVSFHGKSLEGHIDLTPRLSAAIATAQRIDIVAPNEMGEPWYTGPAPALKRLVKECR